jgi:hypothetical protein
MVTLCKDSLSILHRTENISDKICRENRHFRFKFFFFENRAVYEIRWKNTVERGRPQMTIWRMRVACWMPKALNTHSEYVNTYFFSNCNNGCTNAPQCLLYVRVHCLSFYVVHFYTVDIDKNTFISH